MAGRLEKRQWHGDLSAFGGRKSKAGYSYEAYVPDEIGELDLALPAEIAETLTESDRAVVSLNETPPAIENLEALARQLLRAESVGSSRIEGLELSHRRLARASFAPEAARDVTAESILGNIRAMEHAVGIGGNARLTTATILEIHRILLAATRDKHIAGVLRTEQNWIGGSPSGPRNAEFVPPPHEYVERLLGDLAAFMERDDVPAIAQAAIAHAQFETIHPFADGNGRVGRCLIHVILRRRRIATRYVPPISLVLAGNSRDYIRGLNDFRAGKIAEWCGTFAAATRTAARGAVAFAEKIGRLQDRWLEIAGGPRQGSTPRKIISLLPTHPILDVKTAQRLAGVSDEAARLTMNRLETAGVVKQVSLGKRNRAWEAQGLFDLLNEFEREMAAPRGAGGPRRPAPR